MNFLSFLKVSRAHPEKRDACGRVRDPGGLPEQVSEKAGHLGRVGLADHDKVGVIRDHVNRETNEWRQRSDTAESQRVDQIRWELRRGVRSPSIRRSTVPDIR